MLFLVWKGKGKEYFGGMLHLAVYLQLSKYRIGIVNKINI